MNLHSVLFEDKRKKIKRLAAENLFKRYLNIIRRNLEKDLNFIEEYLNKAQNLYEKRLQGNPDLKDELANVIIEYANKRTS